MELGHWWDVFRRGSKEDEHFRELDKAQRKREKKRDRANRLLLRGGTNDEKEQRQYIEKALQRSRHSSQILNRQPSRNHHQHHVHRSHSKSQPMDAVGIFGWGRNKCAATQKELEEAQKRIQELQGRLDKYNAAHSSHGSDHFDKYGSDHSSHGSEREVDDSDDHIPQSSTNSHHHEHGSHHSSNRHNHERDEDESDGQASPDSDDMSDSSSRARNDRDATEFHDAMKNVQIAEEYAREFTNDPRFFFDWMKHSISNVEHALQKTLRLHDGRFDNDQAAYWRHGTKQDILDGLRQLQHKIHDTENEVRDWDDS